MDPMALPGAPCNTGAEVGVRWWCACGRSAEHPYCDGSHRGTGITPVRAARGQASAQAGTESVEAGAGGGTKALAGLRWAERAPRL